jgi:hypothetical protein
MSSNLISGTKIKQMTSKKQQDKWWRVKLDSETLHGIWNASKPFTQRNKKKYTRKTKHNNE